MVESIFSYEGGAVPVLTAGCTARSSNPVSSPAETLHQWPSVYVIEGLGQCCSLLSVLRAHERRFEPNGSGPADFIDVLAKLEAPDGPQAEMLGDTRTNTDSAIRVLASVEVEILCRVGIGDRLRYKVEQSHAVRELSRFTVQAFVEDRMVAHGTIIGARLGGAA